MATTLYDSSTATANESEGVDQKNYLNIKIRLFETKIIVTVREPTTCVFCLCYSLGCFDKVVIQHSRFDQVVRHSQNNIFTGYFMPLNR
jgi:hypothetical protein